MAPAKNTWRSLGLNVLGGVSAFFIAQGIASAADVFLVLPQGITTAIFVTSYSGMVVVFVIRVWEDATVLTQDLKILIITEEQEMLQADHNAPQIQPTLFDKETYEAFKALFCCLPREFTVIKLNRLFFLEKLGEFPNIKMQELVRDQKAFSQLLSCLKSANYIRTDGFSFSVQPGTWETKRQEMQANQQEFNRWRSVANGLLGVSSN
ncbi:MAG: hypothetical protein FVQ81_02845 [Candidatus Glassbacteria bacterium]|nr:hypothetical protein [Candidatus Glassbacteria bacterium]